MAKKSSTIASFTADEKAWLKSVIDTNKPVEYIETGNVGMDLVLTDGKGLPMGSSTLFWARPGSGKTTVITDTCKRLIKKFRGTETPFRVLYLAVEDSRGLMTALGMDEFIDSKEFLYVHGQLCWRQVERLYEAVLAGHENFENIKLIVIDSINNVLSDQNTKNSAADGDFGTKARERSAFYSKILPLCKEKGISSFFISQARKKQGAPQTQYAEQNRAAVSDVDLHNVDIILKCSANSQSPDAEDLIEKTAFGEEKVNLRRVFKMDPRAADCKNRYITGNTVELLFEKGSRVLNFFAVKKLMEVNKLIRGSGTWFSFDPELCSTFNLPENKIQRKEVNEIVETHIGEFIDLLKKMGKYKVKASEIKVAASTDEEEE